MVSIARAVKRFKDEFDGRWDHRMVVEACQRGGYEWRDRVLTPVVTFRLFILQILHGNVACRTLGHLSGLVFTASAYCQARARLPVDVFGFVASGWMHRSTASTGDGTGVGRWRGHRVMMIDGTGVSMPDEPALAQRYGQPAGQRRGCGFPVMHVLLLFDAATGLIADLVSAHHQTHDLSQASKVHPSLGSGDVLVGDRGFCSYAHLALLIGQNVHAVLRAHQRLIVDFTPRRAARGRSHRQRQTGQPASRQIKRLGHEDQWVEYPRPEQRPDWMSKADFAALPESIVVRELRYRVCIPGRRTRHVTVVTTLLDPRKYPKQEVAELYHQRWQTELYLRDLKQTLGMDVLHCRTVEGIAKERWMFVLVYNLVRCLVNAAAQHQGVTADRISFLDALDCLRYRPPDTPLPPLTINPKRPGRFEPRAIKRRKSRYPCLTQPRQQWKRQFLATQRTTP
jgi:hypothetical protein